MILSGDIITHRQVLLTLGVTFYNRFTACLGSRKNGTIKLTQDHNTQRVSRLVLLVFGNFLALAAL